VGSLDLPDQPDEAGQAEKARRGGADRPRHGFREMSDPDERGRVYDAMRAHCADPQTTKQAEGGPESGQPPDVTGQRGYRDEVSRFREIWAKHEERWPAMARSAEDRSSDSPRPHDKDGNVPSDQERRAENDAVGRVREAEGKLSADMRAIEEENKYGGWLAGFEFRLKGEDRLKEKIAERREGESDKSPTEILRKIADVIRYTYCFQPGDYTRGYYDIKERLESRGHEMYHSRNYWTDPEYKGINTRWVTSDGQRFEVQLHTPDSFHAKHDMTHEAYKRIRNPATSRAERSELHAFQCEVSSRIQVPDGVADIPDYQKEGF
jgi:hypothetical protein